MPSTAAALLALSLAGLVQSQAVIISAKGDSGTSKSLFVDPNNQNDANFISQAEIVANIVNECGRTLALGNIDIGEQTELALTAGEVTKVKTGSTVAVTISQRTPQGAGPFTCDMDLTSNSNGIVGQTPLKVTQDSGNGANGNLNIKVELPKDMACVGASTGNVCTVRCRNAANFGGCFAVQQTDVIPGKNSAATISTAQNLQGVLAQVQQNQKDLAAANKGLSDAAKLDDQGVKIADALLKVNPSIGTPAAATPTPSVGNDNGNGNGNGNGRGNRNGNGNGNGRGDGNGNGNGANRNGANGNNGNGNGANRNGANGNNGNGSGNGNGANRNGSNGNNGNGNGNGANRNNGNGNGNGNANNNANGNGNGNGNGNAINGNFGGNRNNANANGNSNNEKRMGLPWMRRAKVRRATKFTA